MAIEKQVFNYVMGDGEAVYSPDHKTRLAVDHSKPITLTRCAEIHAAACKLACKQFQRISIYLSVYSHTPGNECGDFAETCFMNKRWEYTAATNTLLIWDRDEPVYENCNGVITRDSVALWDSMSVL